MNDQVSVDSHVVDAVAACLPAVAGRDAAPTPAQDQARVFLRRLEQRGLVVAPREGTDGASALHQISEGLIDLFSSEDRKLKYSALLVLFLVLVVLYIQPLVILFGLLLSGVAFFMFALTRRNSTG
ncbi:hypothetical protein [Komagataeibacter swingsii]|uniref:Uncharacterized protein n=1 Tax=Komagataeibacter swingsii TaxID=215220 RepID=A0A850NXS3_9PROT|nr:hypothetical protein [Komagataeibacter swingsii]AHI24245.1 hypothetical protein H845_282 [Komagataeibacter xylinus E25]NVN37215.1 hypothetical protein [Komagataeibacter swingsii]RFO99235.1 hypothetical protein BGC31_11460 [Komagataeibacter xylinus]RFP06264.1 hypothetical protein BFX83_15990 [Komagataeibacter xylinus]